jgi:hypothetical protein
MGNMRQAKRIAWPLQKNTKVDLTKFEQYLVSNQGLLADTARQHLHRLSQFYGMFALPGNFSQEGFAASLVSSGVADQWLALPLMKPSLPHTGNICNSLNHNGIFLLGECNKKKHLEAARCITLFIDGFCKPLRTNTHKARAAAEPKLRELDGEKISQLPDQDTLKKAVHNSLVDLHWAWVANKQESQNVNRLKNGRQHHLHGLDLCKQLWGQARRMGHTGKKDG